MSLPPIETPGTFEFMCVRCGQCCREPFPVYVAPKALRAMIRALGQTETYRGAVPEALITVQNNRVVIRKKEKDGTCLLLDDDGLCLSHKVGGQEAKPAACRYFPFFFRQTGDRLFVGFSFVCTEVRKHWQRLTALPNPDIVNYASSEGSIATTAAELENAPPSHHYLILLEPPHLDQRIALDWPQYEIVETTLLELLADTRRPLSERFKIMDTFLRMLADFAFTAELHPELLNDRSQDEIVQYFCNRMRDRSSPVFRTIEIIPSVRSIRKRFLKTLSDIHTSKYKQETFWQRLFRKRRRVRIASILDAEPAQSILAAYISHCIWRKDLLVPPRLALHGSIQKKMCELITAAALACDIADREKAGPKIQEGDVLNAIRLVERDVVLHAPVELGGKATNIIRTYIERNMRQKTFVASLLAS